MTIQFTEELREGVSNIVSDAIITGDKVGKGLIGDRWVYDFTDEILQFLKSKGVVRRVDRELPSIFDCDEDVISALEYRKKLAGFTAVEEIGI